jgi:hypothetical protein
VAIPIAFKVAAPPNDTNKPIPREKIIAEDKLKAEGGLAETKVILRWHFNFRSLTITLPEHKYIAWLQEIQQMIKHGIPLRSRWSRRLDAWDTLALSHPGYITS